VFRGRGTRSKRQAVRLAGVVDGQDIGVIDGTIHTIGGAVVGGFFIEFVPNFANDISDAAPWAIYGMAMLLFMYVMPRGVVGTLGPWLTRHWLVRATQQFRAARDAKKM